MRYLRHTTSLVAALVTAISFAAPATAQAQSYNHTYVDCKRSDTDNKIAGGVIGAIAGGIIGSQVSGSGARTEGSALGAALGAAAGAGIAGEKRDCDEEAYYGTGSTYYTGQNRVGTTYRTVPARTYGSTSHNSGYTTVRHGGHNGYNTRSYKPRQYDRGYRSSDRNYRHYDPLARVDSRIRRLRAEGRSLREQARYDHSPWLRRAIRENGRALERAKDRRRAIKRSYR